MPLIHLAGRFDLEGGETMSRRQCSISPRCAAATIVTRDGLENDLDNRSKADMTGDDVFSQRKQLEACLARVAEDHAPDDQGCAPAFFLGDSVPAVASCAGCGNQSGNKARTGNSGIRGNLSRGCFTTRIWPNGHG